MANRKKLIGKRRTAFLESLSNNFGDITAACAEVGISSRCYYDTKERDDEFKELAEQAIERGIENGISKCRRRAFHGFQEPIYQGGELVGTKRKFSDLLAIFLIKKHRPEYREHVQLGVSGEGFALNVNIGNPDPEDNETDGDT